MNLYNVIIGNSLDDSLKVHTVLSIYDIRDIHCCTILENYTGIKIGQDYGEYLYRIERVDVLIFSTDEVEHDKLTELQIILNS